MKYRIAKKVLRCFRVRRTGKISLDRYRRSTIAAAQDAVCQRNARIRSSEYSRVQAIIQAFDRSKG